MNNYRDVPNRIVAYVFWFLFGIFGVHHVYLNRVQHAVACCLTLNFFFFGWLYDLFNLENYLDVEATHRRVPKFRLFQLVYSFIASSLFVAVFHYNFPDPEPLFFFLTENRVLSESLTNYFPLLYKAVYQLGVCCFSLLGMSLLNASYDVSSSASNVLLIDSLVFAFFVYSEKGPLKEAAKLLLFLNPVLFTIFRQRKVNDWIRRDNFFVRMFKFIFIVLFVLALVLLAVLKNVRVQYGDKKVAGWKPLKDFVQSPHFFKLLTRTKEVLASALDGFVKGGPKESFRRGKEAVFAGNKYVRSVLVLEIVGENINSESVKKKYKELVKKYHPDKKQGNKEEWEKRMAEVNEAYEYLTNYLAC